MVKRVKREKRKGSMKREKRPPHAREKRETKKKVFQLS